MFADSCLPAVIIIVMVGNNRAICVVLFVSQGLAVRDVRKLLSLCDTAGRDNEGLCIQGFITAETNKQGLGVRPLSISVVKKYGFALGFLAARQCQPNYLRRRDFKPSI